MPEMIEMEPEHLKFISDNNTQMTAFGKPPSYLVMI